MNRKHAGFTLIELLVTLTILAVAMMVAVPSMIEFQRNAELTSAVNSLTAAINAAKGEAMKRNMSAYVQPQSQSLWSTGYVVFVDVDANGTFGSGDIPVLNQDGVAANLEITGTGTAAANAPYIRFDGSGYARIAGTGVAYAGGAAASFVNLTFTVRRRDTVGKPDQYSQTRHIMIAQTGRVRTCKPKSASDANCDPASP
jgi:type IV fimbrial biogenesis protein FimT